MRVPVAAKIALHTAGTTGGSAGSPMPVGELFDLMKSHLDLGRRLRRAARSSKSWKLLCTARPRSIVISGAHHVRHAVDDGALRPGSAALLGLMMWLPTSPTTHTFSTLTFFVGVDAHLRDLGEVAAMAELERDAHAHARRRAPARPTLTSRPRARRRRACASASNCSFGAFGAAPAAMAASSRSRRNFTGILRPAACATSSRNDWNAQQNALLRGARSAYGRDAGRDERRVEPEVRHERRRELLGGDVGRRGELLALAEADEVIAPGRSCGPTRRCRP